VLDGSPGDESAQAVVGADDRYGTAIAVHMILPRRPANRRACRSALGAS
jgi:hypothetical protein